MQESMDGFTPTPRKKLKRTRDKLDLGGPGFWEECRIIWRSISSKFRGFWSRKTSINWIFRIFGILGKSLHQRIPPNTSKMVVPDFAYKLGSRFPKKKNQIIFRRMAQTKQYFPRRNPESRFPNKNFRKWPNGNIFSEKGRNFITFDDFDTVLMVVQCFVMTVHGFPMNLVSAPTLLNLPL